MSEDKSPETPQTEETAEDVEVVAHGADAEDWCVVNNSQAL
ncbi:hypothetical protein [Actinokineospora sp. UTMC 2448]|nr:hypothetical protein [Actinokineospora sp. UTMC 2448]UVS77319.1 hypothetical protein Actkin_01027 [Actinokineospora sp. UTMC 2448]